MTLRADRPPAELSFSQRRAWVDLVELCPTLPDYQEGVLHIVACELAAWRLGRLGSDHLRPLCGFLHDFGISKRDRRRLLFPDRARTDRR
jgi:hypothetical protein